MEVAETITKKPGVAEIWQSLKQQFASTRKHMSKSGRNWNAFSKRIEPSSHQTQTLSNAPSAACDDHPFILGVPARHHVSEVDDLKNDLRSTAKAILRNLQDEKEARTILANMEEEKTSQVSEDTHEEIVSGKPVEEAPNGYLVNVDEDNDCEAALHRTAKESNLKPEESVRKLRNSSNLHEQGSSEESPMTPAQSNIDHVVKVNSTFSHLKSTLSKSTDMGALKHLDNVAENRHVGESGNQKVFENLNSLMPQDSEWTKSGFQDNLGEKKNEGISLHINGYHCDCQSSLKPAADVNSTLDQTGPLVHHALAECNSIEVSTLQLNPYNTHDEGPTSATDEELMKIINKDVNCLHDPAIDVRYEALHSLHRALLGDFVGEVNFLSERTTGQEHEVENHMINTGLFESADKFAWCVEEIVVKPLLKVFGDSSERCRYLAVSMLIALLQSIPESVFPLLPYIVPVISSRLPIKSLPTEDPASKVEVILVEKSEDLRLLLVTLLHELLKRSKAMIHPFASDVATILTAAACDSNPDVLMKTFAAMALFGEICSMKLKPVAKQLISVTLRSLAHNRHRVRVAALRAIHRLVLCGAHESIYDLTAFRDPNSVPIKAFYRPDPKTQYLALLAGDRSIQVREQLLKTVGSWLRELDERKEHECRLVP
ncbi:hypothetical protein AXG93_1593s1380 [Marchantia polymorpha subsp. ruderalis]|nr:hypothetical protein AXG93_1593s1380 [Marchantia polymorpha subsp. ruderalis]